MDPKHAQIVLFGVPKGPEMVPERPQMVPRWSQDGPQSVPEGTLWGPSWDLTERQLTKIIRKGLKFLTQKSKSVKNKNKKTMFLINS